MKQIGKWFKKDIPDNKWEADYLICKNRIDAWQSIAFLVVMFASLILISNAYINTMGDVVHTLKEYINMQNRMLNATDKAVTFDYLCPATEGYGCEG